MKLWKELLYLADALTDKGHSKEAQRVDTIIKDAGKYKPPIPDAFWSKIQKTPTCWLWMGAKNKNGYGVLTINKKNYLAHRLSWEWANNRRVPKSMLIAHTCDVPNCVNAQHLFLATPKSNADDRVQKDRSAKGEKNGRARLLAKHIRYVRKLKEKGWSERAIAKLFNVSRTTISKILQRKSWSWVE